MTIVYVEGKKYRLIKPEIPDPDYWVRLVPIKEKETTTDKCTHSFYNVYKGDNVTGQRCSRELKERLFNIPVLIKKECRDYGMHVFADKKTWVEYTEAYTDGFYYEKDRVKYFRVKEKDKDPVYIVKTDLVFLTEEETND